MSRQVVAAGLAIGLLFGFERTPFLADLPPGSRFGLCAALVSVLLLWPGTGADRPRSALAGLLPWPVLSAAAALDGAAGASQGALGRAALLFFLLQVLAWLANRASARSPEAALGVARVTLAAGLLLALCASARALSSGTVIPPWISWGCALPPLGGLDTAVGREVGARPFLLLALSLVLAGLAGGGSARR